MQNHILLISLPSCCFYWSFFLAPPSHPALPLTHRVLVTSICLFFRSQLRWSLAQFSLNILYFHFGNSNHTCNFVFNASLSHWLSYQSVKIMLPCSALHFLFSISRNVTYNNKIRTYLLFGGIGFPCVNTYSNIEYSKFSSYHILRCW